MIERFGDPERGGFFTTASDAGELPARRKDLDDSPTPSGNASAAFGLLRLARLSGESAYEDQALGVLRLLSPLAARHALAFAHLLRAADFHLADGAEVAIVGPEPDASAARGAGARCAPHRAGRRRGGRAAAGGPRFPVDGRAAAYVCEHFACQAPVTDAGALVALLENR